MTVTGTCDPLVRARLVRRAPSRTPVPSKMSVMKMNDPLKEYEQQLTDRFIVSRHQLPEKTTLRVLQGHFHRAISAAEGSPKIMQRLSDHWMEMQQHFDSVGLMRRYYARFLVMRAGRGIPKLIDEHIVMLVVVAWQLKLSALQSLYIRSPRKCPSASCTMPGHCNWL